MKHLRATAVVLLALGTVYALQARAQDGDDSTKRESQAFVKYVMNDAQDEIVEIVFKDVSYRVAPDLDATGKRHIKDVALFLDASENVVVSLRHGLIVDLAKGQVKNPFTLLPASIQKAINESQGDDEVQITIGSGDVFGKVRRIKADGLEIQPATRLPAKDGEPARLTYEKRSVIVAYYKDIRKFVNLTHRQDPSALTGQGTATNDLVATEHLRVGDTVQIGFNHGQIQEITSTTLVLHEWKGNNWGEMLTKDRASLTEVTVAPLQLRRSYPVNGNGEVVVKEEKQREGSKKLLTLRGSVTHDQKEYILVGAQLVFQAGPRDSDIATAPAWREEVPIPPVFGEERWVMEKRPDQEDGQVTIYFDPAKNLIPAKAAEAKPYIVRALAATDRDPTGMPRVYSAAALNGDPELLLLLVTRHAAVPAGPDQERQQGLILDALVQFGEAGAKALVEHAASPDGYFTIPVAHEDGSVERKEQKEQATTWKKYDLNLLVSMPGAAAGERGRRLFNLYEERSTELGDGILKIFQAHASESIDALLDVAVSLSGKPSSEEQRRVDDAANIIKGLGETGFAELLLRVKQLGPQGPLTAKRLEVARQRGSKTLPDTIGDAISELIKAKRADRFAKLAHTLEDAKARATEKDWESALSIVEAVLAQDQDMDDAKKLLCECLIHVSDKLYAEKKRGDAAQKLRRVLSSGQKGKGAESRLAKILLEAAREDLDGIFLRRDADQCSETVKKVNQGDALKIAPIRGVVPEGWVPIALSDKGEVAWANHDAVNLAGDASQCSVRSKYLPPGAVRRTLGEVKKLAPEQGAAADQIDGELWIRDALDKYDQGTYAAAYASFSKARELVPNDSRLALATKCWILANGFLLLIFAGVIAVATISIVVVLRSRVKRVRVAEFKYYGKDRIRVERDIDGASTAGTAGAAGNAPAPASADEPPGAAAP
jgi:tetratricopeptide (TPR) repeat protein